jgi:hypothetical protein
MVPESNEYNNVLRVDVPDAGKFLIYLPLIRKDR